MGAPREAGRAALPILLHDRPAHREVGVMTPVAPPPRRSNPRITAILKREGSGQDRVTISMRPSTMVLLRRLARAHELDISKIVAQLVVNATINAPSRIRAKLDDS